jgi:hypothetical protein
LLVFVIDMRPFLLACMAFTLAAAPAWAKTSVSYTHTTGSQSFDEHNLGITLGAGSGTLGGGFDSFSSDASSGTFKTYSLRLTESVGDGSWEIFGSLTPQVSLYQAKSVGFVINSNVPPEDEDTWPGQTESRLGYTRVWHSDGIPQPVDVNQNNLFAGLTYGIAKTTLEASYTKSLYDNDISGLSLRPAEYIPIPGVSQAPQDYPDYWVNGKIEQGLFSWLKVWGSYTRVQYKVGSAGQADSYTTGGGLFWNGFNVSAQFNQFIPGSGLPNKYVSISAGVGF